MRSRYWKLAVILLALGIISTYGWTQSFHSVNRTYLTFPKNGNGTAIVVFAVSNVNVNGEFQISSNNATKYGNPAPVTVVFQNGTKEMANSTMFMNQYSLTAKFHFKGGLGEPGISASGGIANISISSRNPLEVASISNISESFFLHHLSGNLGLYGSNVNYYMIYIDSYATVNVKVVGGSF